jgi:hypothetical protein
MRWKRNKSPRNLTGRPSRETHKCIFERSRRCRGQVPGPRRSSLVVASLPGGTCKEARGRKRKKKKIVMEMRDKNSMKIQTVNSRRTRLVLSLVACPIFGWILWKGSDQTPYMYSCDHIRTFDSISANPRKEIRGWATLKALTLLGGPTLWVFGSSKRGHLFYSPISPLTQHRAWVTLRT